MKDEAYPWTSRVDFVEIDDETAVAGWKCFEPERPVLESESWRHYVMSGKYLGGLV